MSIHSRHSDLLFFGPFSPCPCRVRSVFLLHLKGGGKLFEVNVPSLPSVHSSKSVEMFLDGLHRNVSQEFLGNANLDESVACRKVQSLSKSCEANVLVAMLGSGDVHMLRHILADIRRKQFGTGKIASSLVLIWSINWKVLHLQTVVELTEQSPEDLRL